MLSIRPYDSIVTMEYKSECFVNATMFFTPAIYIAKLERFEFGEDGSEIDPH